MLLRSMIKQILLGMALVASMVSCVKPEDGYEPISNIDNISGFTLSSYKVNGNEFKDQFAGYTFRFSNANTITATSSAAPIKEAEFRISADSFIVTKFTGTAFSQLNKPWVGLKLTTHTMDANAASGTDAYQVQWFKE